MSTSSRWVIAVVAVAVVSAGVVVAVRVGADPRSGRTTSAAPGSEAWVSPTGSGSECSQSSPCAAIGDALEVLPRGGTVLLLGGHYADETIEPRNGDDTRTEPVTVTPAPGVTNAVLGGLRIDVPRVRLENVAGDSVVYFDRGADDSALLSSHLRGPGDDGSTEPAGPSVIVRSDRVLIQANLIEGGHIRDGINVAGYPKQNTGRADHRQTLSATFSEGTSKQQHADCLQIFDTNDLIVANNSLYSCYNTAVILSPGSRQGITNATIQGNFLEGCLPERIRCGEARTVVDMRTIEAKSVTVNHNTMVNGSARLPTNAGVVATNNIVGYLSISDCGTSLTNSLVTAWSDSACKAGLPGTGNIEGAATFADEASGDLRLRAAITRPLPTGARVVDRDGQALAMVGGGPAVTVSRTTFRGGSLAFFRGAATTRWRRPSPVATPLSGGTSIVVVVVSYNTANLLAKSLASVRSQLDDLPGTTVEMVVVDNASVDGSVDIARRMDARVVLSPTNRGFAEACNLGAASSTADLIVLLNPDAVMQPGCLRALVACHRGSPGAGIVGGRAIRPRRHRPIRARPWVVSTLWGAVCFASGLSTLRAGSRWFDPESLGRLGNDTEHEVGAVAGSLLLIHRDLWNRVGGFDTRYFMYGEDADLGARVRGLGYRPRITPVARIEHATGASSSSSQRWLMILRGKVTLMKATWPPLVARVGIRLLLAGTWLRAAASRRGLDAAAPWENNWRQRATWVRGWCEENDPRRL